eukprot:TRINITY_DN44_c0_g1_i4.p1 TRINITY_DN44_c0_g1~~TRINITY_DN44_c0_g1_i4.p1  ORF type:complete len:172 (-),score=36.26 TRINITY_DN44_c0_g1_i4:50-565(-)
MTFLNNEFPENYVPTIFDNYSTNIEVGEKVVVVSLWDTAGQEDYDRLRPLSYPNTDVFLICYSISNISCFESAQDKWYKEIMHYCETWFILVSTKIDLRDDQDTINSLNAKGLSLITTEQGQLAANKIRALAFVETSAKKGIGLKELIDISIDAKLSGENVKKKKKQCNIL